jgi:hypothetical protein
LRDPVLCLRIRRRVPRFAGAMVDRERRGADHRDRRPSGHPHADDHGRPASRNPDLGMTALHLLGLPGRGSPTGGWCRRALRGRILDEAFDEAFTP